MSRNQADPTQVSLDGTEATRYKPVEPGTLDDARRVCHTVANLAADGEIDADPELFANLAVDLSRALERDDVSTDQVADFELEGEA